MPAAAGDPRSAREEGAFGAILFYDGDCGFCSRSVLFVYRHDPKGRVHFASLQSGFAKRELGDRGVPIDMTTLILLDEKGVHLRSTAALRVAKRLAWPWSWGYAAIVVPRFLRDALYRWIAKHRHRLGPAVEACARPTAELRARMRDMD